MVPERPQLGAWRLLVRTVGALPHDARQRAQGQRGVCAAGDRALVNDFFGCDECARHFIQYYEEHEGEQVNNNQIETVLWLWNAHNAVTARLKASEEADSAFEDGVSTRLSRYPTETSCEPCYNASKGEAFHEPHSVFEYLQEVYCFESDTFVCSAFDDPSKGTEGREKAKDEV